MTRKPADNKTHIELDRTADDEDGCLMEEEKSKICSLKTIKALKDADQLASKSLAERKKKNKIKESESPKVPIPKAPVPEEGHAKFEKELLNLPCYHGFLPREDLVTLLRQPGDYILRSTLGNLRPSRQAKNSRTTTQTTVDASVELPAVLTTHSDKATKQKKTKTPEIIVSVLTFQEKENADDDSYQARIRSIKIWRKKNTCTIDGIKFETINELLTFHKITPIVIRKQAVKLKTPIKLASWEFTHKQVELSAKILGGGAFGEVRLGTLDLKSDGNLIRVAIKTLKITSTEQKSQNKALMAEARLSRVLIHPNVLRTYGVAIRQEPVYLISELCPGGSLYSVLRDPKQKHTTAQKVAWCVGSARGVEYLHANKYIHRDLAVRNVLLSEDRTAKISDFGMARQGDNYVLKYVTKTPVKYLAPETLKTFVFSPKSDVFTFGILIWEVFHDAAEPHAGLTTQQVIAMSKKGVFLTCNEKTPEPIRRLISQRIFTVCPENRCNITEVIQRLEKVNEPEPKEVGKK